MARHAAYRRWSPSCLIHLPYSAERYDSECHMLEAHLSHPRKHRNQEQFASTPAEAQHVSKKQKRSHTSEPQYPPAFWDNLSKVDLTKRALRELDRRNKQAASTSRTPDQQLRKRITRRARAEGRQSNHSATHFLCHWGARALKDINQFARRGGPDLSNLRSVRLTTYHKFSALTVLQFSKPVDPLNHTMSRAQSSSRNRMRGSASASNSQSTSNTTKSTGPYNRNFQQNLIDGGVYPDGYEYPNGQVPAQPGNWDEINQRLLQPRSSLSPSRFTNEDFKAFQRADAHASKEKQVTTSVMPMIEGNIEDAKCVSGGIPFTNLDPLTDGTLVPGNPDIYYGARPEQLDRRVRDALRGHIIPSTQDDLPIVPNFFIAVKGPDGSAAVAKRQACYDGALGARSMLSLQSYGQGNLVYDNNAYTFTSTYHDGTLKIYTSHPLQQTDGVSRSEYCMNQFNTWGMTGNVETFRQGATYYRNAREMAKEQRDEAIRQANERVNECQPATSAVDTSFGEATSFASVATLDGTSTLEALSQESQTLSTADSNTTITFPGSVTPSERLQSNHIATKRSNRNSKSLQSQRKRRIADDPDCNGSED